MNELATMTRGPEFDAAYARTQFQLNSDIIALASLGAQRATDPNLRKFSGKIVNERVDMNKKLAGWYPQISCGGCLTADITSGQCLTQPLIDQCGCPFDQAYVSALIGVMQQSMRVANEGTLKLTHGGLFDQANISKRTNYNEIEALQNYQQTGILSKR